MSTSAGIKTGVILRLPSVVRVSICLFVRGLAGETVEGVAVLVGETFVSVVRGRLLTFIREGFSSNTADAGWPLANDFPYVFSYREFLKNNKNTITVYYKLKDW